MIGRAEELSQVEQVIRSTWEGHGQSLLVAGEPGVGKTEVLTHAINQGTRRGLRVLTASGHRDEENLAFAVLADLMHPLLGNLDRLPEVQAQALSGALALGPARSDDRFVVYAAALGLMLQSIEDRPALVVVDDVQWLDGPSRDALRFMMRRVPGEAVGFVLALRADPVDALKTGRDWPESTTTWLHGFDLHSAGDLLEASLGRRLPAGLVERLVDHTHGNPLALLEAGGGLAEEVLTGGRELSLEHLTSHVAADLFATRLDRLTGEAHDALLLACLHGEGPDCSALFSASQTWGLTEVAFEQLEAEGLLQVTGTHLQLRHSLLQTAVLARTDPSHRRSAHRVLAEKMVSPGDLARQAWHLSQATLGQDEPTAQLLERSGEEAATRSGFAAAAVILERAANLSPAPGEAARRRYAGGEFARQAGDIALARRLLSACLSGRPTPDVQAQVARALSRIDLLTSDLDVARERLTTSAELLCDAATTALLANQIGFAAELLGKAVGLTSEPGPSLQAAMNIVSGMRAIRTLADNDVQAAAVSQTIRTAAHAPDTLNIELALFLIRWAWYLDLQTCRALVRPLVREMRECAGLAILPFALSTQAYLDLRAGQLTSAFASSHEATGLAGDVGNELAHFLSLGTGSLAAAWSGDQDVCRATALQAISLRPRFRVAGADNAFEALGHLELSLGNYEAAITHLTVSSRLPGASAPDLTRWSHGELAEAMIRLGQPLPGAMVEHIHTYTESEIPTGYALASRLRGLLATDEEMRPWFDRSVHGFTETSMPLEAARTQLCLGERLRRAGDKIAARRSLEAAHATFQTGGAQQWARRASAELAATGIHLQRSPDTLPALTPQEHQVAALVAGGASNREAAVALFISPKTVEAHLGRVYRKLGLRTRTELAHRFATTPLSGTDTAHTVANTR